MHIGKITLTFTNSIVLTGDVSFNPDTGLVLLPSTLLQAIDAVQQGECGPNAVMTVDGQRYKLTPDAHDGFAAEVVPGTGGRRSWPVRAAQSLKNPTNEQRQQMGRSAHALGISSAVGATGYAHTLGFRVWTFLEGAEVWGLFILAVLLFATGNILSENSK
jgi:hypothetical protein